MRTAFSKALVEAAQHDPRVLLLTGDHGYALFDDFRKVCPDQYINAGVAEQNMVGVAAGLSKGGFRPVVYGLSAFVPIRVLEQIKLDVCYENLHVLFIGDGAGLVYSSLGTSHQSTEDIAAVRALPNLTVLSPGDAFEMTGCMRLALAAEGPVYLRMGKSDVGTIHARPPQIEWGRLLPVLGGSGPLAWIATGSMVQTALTVAAQWPGSAVWSAPSIKPLDVEQVTAICQRYEIVVVLEEHSVFGGLGSAIAEMACTRAPAWVCRIGVKDRFSQFCGSYSYLLDEHHLTPAAVTEQVHAFLANLPGALVRKASGVPAERRAA
jgi:transketolase